MSGASRASWLALLPGTLLGAQAWCQDNPYIYVKMPLTVPWTLYFMFLGAVLIPFVVMIVLAWRRPPPDGSEGASAPPPRVRPGSGG